MASNISYLNNLLFEAVPVYNSLPEFSFPAFLNSSNLVQMQKRNRFVEKLALLSPSNLNMQFACRWFRYARFSAGQGPKPHELGAMNWRLIRYWGPVTGDRF